MAAPAGQSIRHALPHPAATADFASLLEQAGESGTVIYLHGPLGAGKTTLVRAFLKAAGFGGRVKSPTFTLVETYATSRFPVAHFDLFRLTDPIELEWIGFKEYLQADTVCFIEWPEKGEGFLPPPDLVIYLQPEGQGRQLEVRGGTAKGERILARLKSRLSWRFKN